MEALVGSLLSYEFNQGCVCERGSCATARVIPKEIETTTAELSWSLDINVVRFNHVLGRGGIKRCLFSCIRALLS